jgi:hypothetical protein
MKQINPPKIAKDKKRKTLPTMPTFTCTCGEKILIVPDLHAMNKAIKNHMIKHTTVTELFLAEQVLKALNKQPAA